MTRDAAIDLLRECAATPCDQSDGRCWSCGERRPCTRERARMWLAEEDARQARTVLEPHRETLAAPADGGGE